MLEYVLIGGGFAVAAAVQPGPLQAFLFARVAEKGWQRTLPAALSPLISDGPIAVLVLLVLNRLPATMGRVLQGAGGVLLLYLAVTTLRQWRRQVGQEAEGGHSAHRTLLQAALVNLLNPNPYLGWSLVLGPTAIRAWREAPADAVALVGAFYATMVATLALTILLFGTTRSLGPRGRRVLVLVSAATLAAIGIYQLAASVLGRGPS